MTDPNVAARFDSEKPAAAFAQCAAAALSPDFKLSSASGAYSLIRQEGLTVNARWDFFPTNDGSQAELRNGSKDDAGADAVRRCI